MLVISTLVLIGVGWLGRLEAGRSGARSGASDPAGAAASPTDVARWIAFSLAAFAVFWLFRSQTLLLGDGFAIVESLPAAAVFHPLEPMANELQHLIYRVAGPLFGAAENLDRRAWDAAALGSAAAGGVFVAILYPLAREMIVSRGRPGDSPGRFGWIETLLLLLLLSQGYVVIFFGYVEVYSYYAVGVGAFLWLAVRHLNGRLPLWPAGAAAALAISLHLSGLALLPPLLLLFAIALRSRERRATALRDLVVTILVFVGCSFAVGSRVEEYSLAGAGWEAIRLVLTGEEQISPDYFLSSRHLRDFVNLQLLLGPLALPAFLPAAAWTVSHLRGATSHAAFYVVAGASYLSACIVAGDSNLGYARNWDLLAPAGLVLSVAALGLVVQQVRGQNRLRGLVLAGLALSMFHTVPWIAINASAEHSLARFYTLPLDQGRMESTVAYWFAREGELDQARLWATRSLEENPLNPRAHSLLGDLARQEERYEEAVRAYAAAAGIRPDIERFQLRLLEAAVYANRLEAATGALDRLEPNRPDDPALLAARSVVLAGQGRYDEARAALTRAADLEPESPAYNSALRHFDRPDPYPALRDELWPLLFPR